MCWLVYSLTCWHANGSFKEGISVKHAYLSLSCIRYYPDGYEIFRCIQGHSQRQLQRRHEVAEGAPEEEASMECGPGAVCAMILLAGAEGPQEVTRLLGGNFGFACAGASSLGAASAAIFGSACSGAVCSGAASSGAPSVACAADWAAATLGGKGQGCGPVCAAASFADNCCIRGLASSSAGVAVSWPSCSCSAKAGLLGEDPASPSVSAACAGGVLFSCGGISCPASSGSDASASSGSSGPDDIHTCTQNPRNTINIRVQLHLYQG